MDLAAFKQSVSADAAPPPLSAALQGLWWSARGDWEKAHQFAQQGEGTRDADWVHAYLHRVEGDLPNASYWYRQAKQPVNTLPLPDEWDSIAAALLAAK